jgi:dienelactone hydrolase
MRHVVIAWAAAATLAGQITAPPPYETRFYTHDARRLEAYLYRPSGNGPFPLVVYNHGSRPGEERIEWPVAFIGRLLTGAGYAVLVPERRGYGKSEGPTFTEEVGADRGHRFIARLDAEADDLLKAVDHVIDDPGSRIDPKRIAIMGWSFGGIVTTLAASRSPRFAAVLVQAPGALNWDRSPDLRAALTRAATRITVPIQCMAAENDATTESARAICKNARGAQDLKIYPPFTPTTVRANTAPGHALFGSQGVTLWGPDALAFLARHLPAPSSR